MSANTKLAGFSLEELEAEIELRKRPSVPQPLDPEEIEWGYIVDYVEALMANIEAGNELPEDFEYELFDTVMDVVYGSDNWKPWWNKKLIGR
jgi:hypothetical protein